MSQTESRLATLARRCRAIARRLALVLLGVLFAALARAACENPGTSACETLEQDSPVSTVASGTPLAALQSYLQQRGLDVESLTAAGMVDVMLDWYRQAPMGARSGDQLIFRYGGWSEGCATAFKFSVLRRIEAGTSDAERLAGITMMFEPSGQGELPPFSAQSGDAASVEAFAAAIKATPAYTRLRSAKPLGVLIETGGVR